MPLLEVPATKSSLLALRRQLVFAEEGYALLDQKRELLLFELGRVSARAAAVRRAAEAALAAAFSLLRGAELAAGGAALDRAALGVALDHGLELTWRRLMGLRLPSVAAAAVRPGARFGPGGVPAGADAAMAAFAAAVPALAELAGLETSRLRLARELKKTQRRCNALSKKLIPDCRETIAFLSASLEERECESFVMLRIVRDRLRSAKPA
jgi:V/A-type H+-transporting ATPase subunit D